MKISESIKRAINNAFVNTIFPNREEKAIHSTLKTKVHGSDNVGIIPTIPNIKVETIDETHDKLTLIYEDYRIEGVVTWRPTKSSYVFVKYE